MTTRLGLLLALLIGLYAVVLLRTPQPLDWSPDYRHTSTDPLGARALHTLLPAWTGRAVETVDVTPFERLADSALTAPAPADAAYLFLTDTFAPDRAETARLRTFMRRGGLVVVAADDVTGAFLDSLGGLIVASTPWSGRDSTLRLDAGALHRNGGYRFPLSVRQARLEMPLDSIAPAGVHRLGSDAQDRMTLVRVAIGRGGLVLSTTPAAFSNAALVGEGDGAAYVAGVLTYLGPRRVLWDTRHKPGGTSSSLLRVVHATPPLRWAYGLLVVGVLLLVAFRGRRWQRAVPVVAPPPNALLAFVTSVGHLYASQGDERALVERRRRALFDRLRERAAIAAPDLSAETEAALARFVPPDDAAALFDRLRRADTHPPTGADLVALDHALTRVYHHLGR